MGLEEESELFVVDFAKKQRLEKIVDYKKSSDDNANAVFKDYSVVTKSSDFKGSAKYALAQLVMNAESQLVKSQDDPIYRASIQVAKVVTSDGVLVKALALAGYLFANEVSGKNIRKKTGR